MKWNKKRKKEEYPYGNIYLLNQKIKYFRLVIIVVIVIFEIKLYTWTKQKKNIN